MYDGGVFPLVFNIISSHLLLHESGIAVRFGPVQARWMFHYEHHNSLITQRVTARSEPEACATSTFQLVEWVDDVILGE